MRSTPSPRAWSPGGAAGGLRGLEGHRAGAALVLQTRAWRRTKLGSCCSLGSLWVAILILLLWAIRGHQGMHLTWVHSQGTVPAGGRRPRWSRGDERGFSGILPVIQSPPSMACARFGAVLRLHSLFLGCVLRAAGIHIKVPSVVLMVPSTSKEPKSRPGYTPGRMERELKTP